ncbi:hypothetical protein BJ973_008528 [Actinoplanes tereljensis]
MGHTRRWVLGAGLMLTGGLAGCGSDADSPTPVDALQPLLDEALTLAIAYDRAILSLPDLATRLSPLAADHRAHAAELATLIGRTTPTSASASSPASAMSAGATADEVIAAFQTAEQSAAKNAVAACRATTALRAGTVGSIAACRATHVEALR